MATDVYSAQCNALHLPPTPLQNWFQTPAALHLRQQYNWQSRVSEIFCCYPLYWVVVYHKFSNFISFSQTHTTLAGSRLYFHPSRSNPFVVAIGNELRRLMARSTAPRRSRSFAECWISFKPYQVTPIDLNLDYIGGYTGRVRLEFKRFLWAISFRNTTT